MEERLRACPPGVWRASVRTSKGDNVEDHALMVEHGIEVA